MRQSFTWFGTVLFSAGLTNLVLAAIVLVGTDAFRLDPRDVLVRSIMVGAAFFVTGLSILMITRPRHE